MDLLKSLKCLFKGNTQAPEIKPTGKTIKMDSLHMYFFDFETGRISGFMDPHPNIGDYCSCEMVSGKKGLFQVIKIDSCMNAGQYFGTVKFIGYEGEL